MADLILGTIWKVIKGIVMIAVFIGILNFILTPGNIDEKIEGAYDKTINQGAQIAHIGENIFLSESDTMVRTVGNGVWKLREEKEKSIEMSLGSTGK